MGCATSYLTCPKPDFPTVSPPREMSEQLDDHQKQLVRESWKVFDSKRIAIGRKMFVNLFQVYPDMQDLFPEFRGAGRVDCIEATSFLNGHSNRLMTSVKNAILSLDDSRTFAGYLEELGRRHKRRNFNPKHLERMGAALMSTFQELYPDLWSSELEEAWYLLYQSISRMMIRGLKSTR